MIIRVPHTFLFKVIFSLLCLFFLYTLTLRIILVFSYIPETGGASLDVLYGILRILKGRNLYNNPELPPYAVVQCMPLYYYVVAGLSQILGISQSIHAVSVINRLCALGFNLLLFIPLQRILRKIFDCQEKFSHWTTFLAIFILIPSADYSGTGSLCLLATAFSIYYFLCFLNLYDDKYGSELVLSGIGASLAFFINQYSFFLLVGILLFLLIYIRDKKATLLFVFSSSAALLFLFIVLIGVNANYWFLNVTYGIKSLFTVYDWNNMSELPLHNFLYIALLSLLLGAFIFMKRLKLREKFLRFIALFNILFVLTDSFYSGPKFISISLFFSIALLLTFVELKELDSVTRLKKIILIITALFLVLQLSVEKNWLLLKDLQHSKSDYTNCSMAATYVKHNVKNDEYILSEIHSENMLNMMIGERALFPTRKLVVESAYPDQLFNYLDFAQRVKEGKIKYLITGNGMKPSLFLNVALEGYEKDATIRGFDIYIYNESR